MSKESEMKTNKQEWWDEKRGPNRQRDPEPKRGDGNSQKKLKQSQGTSGGMEGVDEVEQNIGDRAFAHLPRIPACSLLR